jgi:opacity protein-like surface antigen
MRNLCSVDLTDVFFYGKEQRLFFVRTKYWEKIMKKSCLLVLLALFLTLPCLAHAGENGIYVVPKFVTGYQNTDWSLTANGRGGSHDSTRGFAGFSLAGGYDLSPMYNLPLRGEIEYGYNSRVEKSVGGGTGRARVQTLMANGYWDITNIMNFTPYVGAGLGLAFIRTSGGVTAGSSHYSANDTDMGLAAQLGFGCSYAFTSNISADLGYRYLWAGDGDSGCDGYSLKADSVRMHQISLGLRISF